MKAKLESLAEQLTKEQPEWRRPVTIHEVIRMVLEHRLPEMMRELGIEPEPHMRVEFKVLEEIRDGDLDSSCESG